MRVTLGPKSKCVLVEKKWGQPLVCNDGVTIAKEFELEDPEENLGAQMIREAAEKTGEAVGDGTSTSTLLAHAIFAEGSAQHRGRRERGGTKARTGPRPSSGRQGTQEISRPVTSRLEKEQVATISAHNDACDRRTGCRCDGKGRPGRRDHRRRRQRTTETALEVVEGMQLDRGLSVAIFRDRSGEDGSGAGRPIDFVHEKKISTQEFLPLLEKGRQGWDDHSW